MITLIAAVAENNALGKNNDLLWHLPKDFKRFKEITSGHYIIMGRKTFESFPKPLPNRTHIVISRQANYKPESCIVVENLEKAFEICPKSEDIFVIGGGEIYKQTIAIADRLDITKVHSSFDAEVFFPEIDMNIWQLDHEEFHQKDEKNQFDFTFQTFNKKNSLSRRIEN
jgi:dihydrofolate reductase